MPENGFFESADAAIVKIGLDAADLSSGTEAPERGRAPFGTGRPGFAQIVGKPRSHVVQQKIRAGLDGWINPFGFSFAGFAWRALACRLFASHPGNAGAKFFADPESRFVFQPVHQRQYGWQQSSGFGANQDSQNSHRAEGERNSNGAGGPLINKHVENSPFQREGKRGNFTSIQPGFIGQQKGDAGNRLDRDPEWKIKSRKSGINVDEILRLGLDFGWGKHFTKKADQQILLPESAEIEDDGRVSKGVLLCAQHVAEVRACVHFSKRIPPFPKPRRRQTHQLPPC